MGAAVRIAATCVLALLPLAGAAAGAAASAAAPAAPVQQAPEGEVPVAPVEVDGVILFEVRGATSLPAAERAAAIAGRIVDLAEDPTFDPATLRAEEIAGGGRVASADGRLVMNVYDADSVHEGFSREGVSASIVQRVRKAIEDYRAARTPEARVSGSVRGFGALGALVIALWLVQRLARRAQARLEQHYRARLPNLAIGSFEIVRAERMWAALRALTSLLRWAISLMLAFVVLRYALAQFPHTRGLALRLDTLVLDPVQRLGMGFVDFIPDLLFLAVLFVITRWFMRLVLLFFQAVERGTVTLRAFEPEWAMPTYRLVRIGIVAFALVVAYPYIPGADTAAFKGVTLFLGVLVSLGSSSMISNIIAGYMLTYRRAFRIGDRVRIGDVTGDVTEIHLQVTHLRTIKNEEVTIPNSVILGSHVMNYSTLARSHGLILSVTVGISYEVPWRQVEAMLLMAAGRTPGLLAEPPPFVHQLALGDFAVTYELNAVCDTPHAMRELYTALHRSVLDVFNEFGVQIMTPAYMSDSPAPKVVPRERWHAAPAGPPETPAARP